MSENTQTSGDRPCDSSQATDRAAVAAAGLTAVRFEYSPDFPGILKHLGSALAITTYQAGKLAVVGVEQDRLEFSFHNVDQAMGIAVGSQEIALGSRRDIFFLRAAHDIAPGVNPVGTFDSAWLTRQSFRTGNIHGHELAWGRDGLWVVNTLFSTLCTLHKDFSFVPRWRPPFISELAANDRCHLNGLAMLDGQPKFVTAHGDSNQPGGWRPGKASGGVVIDVPSGEVVARGFAMPHSPRLSRDRLWVLNSGAGQLGTVDLATGRFEPVESFPGYVRGLAFQGQFAFVGLSKIREKSVFGGMPIEEHRSTLRCGIAVVDLVSGRTVATLQFHSGVDEIFAVSVLPNCLRPCLVGPLDTQDDHSDIWVVPGSAGTGDASDGAVFSFREGKAPAEPQAWEGKAPAEPLSGTAFRAVPARQEPRPPSSRIASHASADALAALAEDLQRQGRYQEALLAFRKAIEAQPRRASLHCNLGNLWQKLDDQDQAIACYRQALEVDATCIPARQNLGHLLFNHGLTTEAVEQFEALLKADPSAINRLLSAVVLPVVYDSAEAVAQWRRRLIGCLDVLIADGASIDTQNALVPTSFFLAYQGQNDAPVMRRLGQICQGSESVPAARNGRLTPRSDGRLRVGFLSAYFRDHTIGRLNLGRIQHLDRQKFEVTVLSASSRRDAVSEQFRAAADRFVELPHDVATARHRVIDQDLDVLIFADVGMDALTATLAWSRLAPVQCVTWGHPETTGSPHMDYFLSSELLETPAADAHYTERLVRLPLLGTYFERPALTHSTEANVARASARVSREETILRGLKPTLHGDRHVYLCPQTLFKFHPDFDGLLAGILKADPAAELVLLEGRVRHWTDQLKRRFERTLPEAGRRVRFLPAIPRADFLKLLATADVILDPPHFGGGHSSYEALAVGTPVVTLPGEFLRSRITLALYRKMGFVDLVADSADEYVQTAVRLANDKDFRLTARQRIQQLAPVLFADLAEIRCLEDWLWSLTAEGCLPVSDGVGTRRKK